MSGNAAENAPPEVDGDLEKQPVDSSSPHSHDGPPAEQEKTSPHPPPNHSPPSPHQHEQKSTKSVGSAGSSASPDGPAGPETPQEKKAKQYLIQAEKKMKSAQSFLGGLFSGASKMEEAADLYVRAANSFKVAKKWIAAGEAFCHAADVHRKLEVKHEAAANLVDAGQVMKKEDPKRAVECYLQAAEIYTDMGRFSMAARHHNHIAEICEGDLQDYDMAITHYEQAADYFKGEDSSGSANRVLLKVAHMCALLQQFAKAARIFEEVGRTSLENTLLKYSAKEHFFKASICHFCIGAEDAKDAIEGFRQIHPGFEGTREIKLLQDLLEAQREEDPDRFADIVKEYDTISRIDQWLTAQLLHIKKSITSAPDIN